MDVSSAGVLDALEIDDYLQKLLIPRVLHSYVDEAVIRSGVAQGLASVLLRITLLVAVNCETPGSAPLRIKVTGNRRSNVFILAAISTIVPLLKAICHILRNRYGRSEGDSALQGVVRSRSERSVSIILAVLNAVLPSLQMASLLGWWAGINLVKSPSPAMIASGITFTKAQPCNNLNVQYGHRRWIYAVLLKAVIGLLPVKSVGDLVATKEM